ncbi:Metacaspase-1 [Ananas comosus]|uniref:Metacaspase-1 n=1 Tax=Ananas comosus TaxID=4615 RepID=A0A199UHX2_ANACO|nr:Metacaspase-1 [Ananas comosus]
MESRNTRTVQCSYCGKEQAVPPGARGTVWCTFCNGSIRVRRGPPGFVKQIMANISSGITSALSGYAAAPANAYRPRSYSPEQGNKKRAVLIGISYVGRSYELKGTVNDVNCMSYLLCTKFGFSREWIRVLTVSAEVELYGRESEIPTRENVCAAMRWLVQGCSAGDSLVFHFSGHGVQKLDMNGDERDGFDEALCPLDFEENGVILDDEINATIVRPLPRNVKLHAVVDACHSGTILDLPYLCRLSRYKLSFFRGSYQWEDHSPPSGEYKGTSGGLAILISGCDDHQTSADTSAFARSTSTGAMTYSFIQAVESDQANTYGNLLTAMRLSIRNGLTLAGISGPYHFQQYTGFSA